MPLFNSLFLTWLLRVRLLQPVSFIGLSMSSDECIPSAEMFQFDMTDGPADRVNINFGPFLVRTRSS